MLALILLFASVLGASKIFVLFGPTQAGKSSFINTIAGNNGLAPAGSGNGLSQTSLCHEYLITNSPIFPNQHIRILDVPGLNDNLHNTSDEQLLERIRSSIFGMMKVNILEANAENPNIDFIDGVFLFEDMGEDLSALARTFHMAQVLFGNSLKSSAMVIYNKMDLTILTGRTPSADLASEFATSYCVWQQTPTAEMITGLKTSSASLAPYRVEGMQQVINEINIQAQRDFSSQIIPKKTIYVPVQKQVSRTRPASRPVQQAYTVYPPAQTVSRTTRIYADANGTIALTVGGSVTIGHNYADVTYDEKITPPSYTAYRTVNEAYTETYYQTETVNEPKQVDDVATPIGHFRNNAKQRKVDEIRSQILH